MPQLMLLCFSEFLWIHNLPENPFCFSAELVFCCLISQAWLLNVETPRVTTWSRKYGNSKGTAAQISQTTVNISQAREPAHFCHGLPKELSTIYFLWAQGCSALLGGKSLPLGCHGTKATAEWQQQLEFAHWNTQNIVIKGLCICRNHEAQESTASKWRLSFYGSFPIKCICNVCIF